VPEPLVLYVSKRFLDDALRAFGAGRFSRKPLVEILGKMNIAFKELDRNEAKEALEKIAETKGLTITISQVLKGIAEAFLLPTPMLAAQKRISFRSAMETGDGVILELLASVSRMFRPTLFYDVWLIVPRGEEGSTNMMQLIRAIVEKTGKTPLTEDEWRKLQPIVEKLGESLRARGVRENLWKDLLHQWGISYGA